MMHRHPYEKGIGNKSYVVQGIPNTKKRCISLQRLSVKEGIKAEASQSTNAKSHGATPKAEFVKASERIVTEIMADVKNSDLYDEIDFRISFYDGYLGF